MYRVLRSSALLHIRISGNRGTRAQPDIYVHAPEGECVNIRQSTSACVICHTFGTLKICLNLKINLHKHFQNHTVSVRCTKVPQSLCTAPMRLYRGLLSWSCTKPHISGVVQSHTLENIQLVYIVTDADYDSGMLFYCFYDDSHSTHFDY